MYIFLLTVIPLCYFLYHEVERKRYAVRGAGFNFFCGSDSIDIYKPLKNHREGLKGEEIPLAARIVAVADVFDALSSKRVYKEAWTEENVLIEMQQNAGRQFDPEVLMSFFEVIPRIREIQASMPDV